MNDSNIPGREPEPAPALRTYDQRGVDAVRELVRRRINVALRN